VWYKEWSEDGDCDSEVGLYEYHEHSGVVGSLLS
jgi:hypothetical protein